MKGRLIIGLVVLCAIVGTIFIPGALSIVSSILMILAICISGIDGVCGLGDKKSTGSIVTLVCSILLLLITMCSTLPEFIVKINWVVSVLGLIAGVVLINMRAKVKARMEVEQVMHTNKQGAVTVVGEVAEETSKPQTEKVNSDSTIEEYDDFSDISESMSVVFDKLASITGMTKKALAKVLPTKACVEEAEEAVTAESNFLPDLQKANRITHEPFKSLGFIKKFRPSEIGKAVDLAFGKYENPLEYWSFVALRQAGIEDEPAEGSSYTLLLNALAIDKLSPEARDRVKEIIIQVPDAMIPIFKFAVMGLNVEKFLEHSDAVLAGTVYQYVKAADNCAVNGIDITNASIKEWYDYFSQSVSGKFAIKPDIVKACAQNRIIGEKRFLEKHTVADMLRLTPETVSNMNIKFVSTEEVVKEESE